MTNDIDDSAYQVFTNWIKDLSKQVNKLIVRMKTLEDRLDSSTIRAPDCSGEDAGLTPAPDLYYCDARKPGLDVACQLLLGHKGQHRGRNTTAEYAWSGEYKGRCNIEGSPGELCLLEAGHDLFHNTGTYTFNLGFKRCLYGDVFTNERCLFESGHYGDHSFPPVRR